MDPKGADGENPGKMPAGRGGARNGDVTPGAASGEAVWTGPAPQILQYLDYRDYLRDFYAHRKSQDPDFSQRAFARAAGLPASCSSLLPAVIRGRRQLSQNLRVKFGKAMKLGEREYRYFDLLVQFNQAKGMSEKNFFFSQLAKFRSSRARIVGETQYRFFSKWYYSAVWNYFGIDRKTRHPGAIAANILPPITPSQAEEAIKLLLEIGLIKKTASGYAVAERHIYTEKDVQAMAARQHVQELMAMAALVFPDLPPERRQYNALMFSISKDGFQAIKDRIRSFQEELREIIDRDRNEDRVYTLTLQLFPNTKAPA